MIREQDVREAIAEMQGQKSPNANTCIKLAAYYTILDHITGETKEITPVDYMYSGSDPESIIIDSDSDFALRIAKKRQPDVWPVIDELMTTLHVINPRLYDAVMIKLG